MAVLLLDETMDTDIRKMVFAIVRPTELRRVNASIHAYTVDIPGFAANEVALARYYTSPKPRIKFVSAEKPYISWKE